MRQPRNSSRSSKPALKSALKSAPRSRSPRTTEPAKRVRVMTKRAASQAAARSSEIASDMIERGREVMDNAASGGRSIALSAGRQIGALRSNLGEAVGHRPIAAMVGAAALGMVLALFFRRTA